MRTVRLGVRILLLGILAAVAGAQEPAFAQKDLPALLERMQAHIKSNDKLTQQYTSEEIKHSRNFDKNGKMTSEHTTKFENIALEGLLYRREVERDGKPLSGKEASAEQKRFDQAVSERRAMKEGHRPRLLSRTYNSDLPLSYLEKLFDNRLLRTETLNGRETVVVESMPKPGANPKTTGEKSSLDWKQTTWIDVQDAIPARIEVELLRDRKILKRGMTLGMDFSRRVEEPAANGRPERAVWLETAQQFKGQMKMYWFSFSGQSETVWTSFKKFQVDMRLLEETLQEIPEAGTVPLSTSTAPEP